VDYSRFLESEIDEHVAVAARTRGDLSAAFATLVEACLDSLARGGKLLFFGNGGSAADAQHLAAELVVRYRTNRPAIAAIALTTDTSVLTAIGNDYGFDDAFARQVEALCRPGDVVIGISTSGNSENVLRGLRAARACDGVAVALLGGDGGRIKSHASIALVVPSQTTARVQEMHMVLGHALCDVLEQTLARVAGDTTPE
jgi:D-sedoheptulose 7-phosphate isomerase